jgi:hypothetical protein
VNTIHKEIEQVYKELRSIKDDMGRLMRFMDVTQKLNSLHQQWCKAFQELTVMATLRSDAHLPCRTKQLVRP